MTPMKLPPKLAKWLSARRRAHDQHEAQHLRAMAKVDMAPRYGRKVRIPPPPGGWNKGRAGGGGIRGGAGRSAGRHRSH